MVARIAALLLSGVALFQQALAQDTIPADLIGTWSSKSNATFTGDGFYDPGNDKLIEPKHTGISYSFSEDGHYESAYYRAIANPERPKCPKGIMQWQHGTFVKKPDGSLVLSPIKVDGRQLYSDPCQYKNAVYTRYNATEKFKQYTVAEDRYHKIPRLDLYKSDGAPLMPLYIAFKPPKMLPTTTLRPLTTETAAPKVKRDSKLSPRKVLLERQEGNTRADQWWWFGVFLTAGGGVMYWFF